MRSNSGQGYVAIDEVEFREIELCEFTPPDAKPVPVTTTVEPTEPPDCKFDPDCLIKYCNKKYLLNLPVA